MKDRATSLPRCHSGVIQSANAGAVRRLLDNALSSGVRPWDLPELRRRAAGLGGVSPARAVSVDENVLVAELLPGGERIVFRGRNPWAEGGRSIVAEKVKNEIYEGATPYSTYVRGVIIDGYRGVLLTGSGDSALVIEG